MRPEQILAEVYVRAAWIAGHVHEKERKRHGDETVECTKGKCTVWIFTVSRAEIRRGQKRGDGP